MKRILFLLCFFLLFSAFTEEIITYGRSVTDGDTFLASNAVVVRLWGVDAPEMDQPWGYVARSALIELVSRKKLTLEKHGESYGRVVAMVKRGKLDVGLELIKMGLAWHAEKYAPDRKDYAQAQAEAKAEKRGLWSEANPIPPWEWRERNKKEISNENRMSVLPSAL